MSLKEQKGEKTKINNILFILLLPNFTKLDLE